ncbi:hypothetical protein Taro_009235, partial [Colocasia esculenta]|nr:hypothetical protein [Colocasia esculenta]
RYGTWRTQSDGCHVRWQRVRNPVHDRDCLPVHVCLQVRDRDCLPIHICVQVRVDLTYIQFCRDCLPVHARRPSDRDRLPADHPSSATFVFFLTTRGKIDPSLASRYITTLVHAYIPGPMDAWRDFPVPVRDLLFDMFTRRFAFTRPEDLPRARAVWEITAQTNLRKSMWEVWDKAMKTTGNRDPMAWVDYGPHHNLERAPTFRELFDRTHKRKGTDDYVTESDRTIAETYDKTMAERYAESTPQPDLDADAWVEAAGVPRKGRVYGFGDSLDTHRVLSSYASSIAPPAHASSSSAPPVSAVEDIRGIIREELRAEPQTQRVELQTQRVQLQTQFSDMVQQFISIMQGVRPTQPAAQDPPPAPDDDEAGTTDDPVDLS